MVTIFAGIHVNRKDVEAILLSTSPLSHQTRYDNFYVLRRNGDEIGAKALMYSITSDAVHHAYEAVQALIDLGFVVRARQRYPTHEHRFASAIQDGSLVFDKEDDGWPFESPVPIPGVEGEPLETRALRFERSPAIRKLAIQYHGVLCQVCGFSFGEKYGDRGEGYIEVHHRKPLSTVRTEHEVDPITDLVVLCANCHRMIDRRHDDVLTLDELRDIVEDRESKKRS